MDSYLMNYLITLLIIKSISIIQFSILFIIFYIISDVNNIDNIDYWEKMIENKLMEINMMNNGLADYLNV